MTVHFKSVNLFAYVIRLERGEEIIDSLKRFAQQRALNFSIITGIGSAEDIKIGFYDSTKKAYTTHEYKQQMEIVSLTGVVSVDEKGEYHIHCHAMFGGRDGLTIGGHLFEAKIAATGEFVLQTYSQQLRRKCDTQTGLYLLDL